jgi:hypothetical protein
MYKKLILAASLCLILSLALSCSKRAQSSSDAVGEGNDVRTIELIRDNHFSRGFEIIGPLHPDVNFEKREVVGVVKLTDEEPVWRLAQWHSKFSIHTAVPQHISKDAVRIENEAKSVTIAPLDPELGDVILAIDSRPEYQMIPRKDGQMWPHLLTEQKMDTPRISTFKELRLHIEAKLLYNERWEPEGYTTVLHCAQIPYVLTIGNVNPASKGYRDFYWFLVPVYDDRYPMSGRFVSEDKADPSAKLIFNLGSSAYMNRSLHDKNWVTIDVDILPMVREGLQTAWAKGYLKDSQNISDYGITSMNFGWEVPGLNRVAIQIRNLSLKATSFQGF